MRFEKFTTKLQEALAEAQSAALGNDNQYIEPQHLLAALLNDQGITGLIAKAGGMRMRLRRRWRTPSRACPRSKARRGR